MESTPEKKLLDKQTRMLEVTTAAKIKTVLRRYGVLIATILVFIVFALITREFVSASNIFNIISMASVMGILSLGLTLFVCAGEFDISFGAISSVCGAVSIILLAQGWNLYLAWTVSVLLGVGFYVINAINVLKVGIPSFVATLGMWGICLGLSRWLTGGFQFYAAEYPAGFPSIGRVILFGVLPTPIISFLIIGILLVLFLEFSFRGRNVYAVGGNPEAASHVGVNVKKTKWMVFLIAGFTTGLAGIIMGSKFGAGIHDMGGSYLMSAIIGCFLGAVFLKDGMPNARGTVVACFLLAILENGFVMTNVKFYMKEIIQGIILVLAVAAVSLLRGKAIQGVKF